MSSFILGSVANHLWQSTVFALLAGALTLLLRRNSARIRYLVWLAASAKFLVPFALLAAMGAQFPWPLGAARGPDPAVFSLAGQLAAQMTPFGGESASALARTAHAGGGAQALAIALGVIWALGMLAVTSRWLVRWRVLRRALRESTESDVGFVIPVRSSLVQLEPAVVGVLRSVLLLPKDMEQRLTPEELRAVLAHERCHVQWRDNLAAALHMLVEAVFWFHPLVWWLGTRLISERERACDEQVLAEGHRCEIYAEGILKICEHCLAPRLPCVAGVAGAHLGRRIEVIMQERQIQRLSGARKLAITTAACATLVAPVAVGVLTSSRAQAEADTQASGGPSFRNVSIRIVPPGSTFYPCVGIEGSSNSDRVQVGCTPLGLRRVIADYYGVAESQVVGQDWSREPYYEITADDPVRTATDRAAAWRKLPAMMRNLLAKQFGMVVRRERKQINGYVLTTSSRGSKLKRDADLPNSDWRKLMWGSPDGDAISAAHMPVGGLVVYLRRVLQAPVVDRTGLHGTFEYEATWKTPSPGTPPDPAAVAKALHDQLGLQLQAKPVTVDVIDVVRLRPPVNLAHEQRDGDGRKLAAR